MKTLQAIFIGIPLLIIGLITGWDKEIDELYK